ncbi:MAG: hypothetical protein QM516_03990 [Limnohabitans sp.]|jgi:hypothetical protein|nr:hypothetical protein [Limnohabitans sp.]
MHAVRLLLDSVLDYAGLFPPAKLDMRTTVANFARYRRSNDAWMLSRLIVPVTQFPEFVQEADPHLPKTADVEGDEPWPMSVLVANASDRQIVADLERIERFNERMEDREFSRAHGRARIDTIETKAATAHEIDRALEYVPDDIFAYFEVPAGSDPRGLITTMASLDAGAKIRTGGLTPEAHPTPEFVARFLKVCRAAEVPFKATAGLHHPCRHMATDVGCMQFGFLNVFIAGCLLWQDDTMSETEIEALLVEEDARQFEFGPHGLAWRRRALKFDEIAEARERFAHGFGSCSFDEPLADLRALGLLPANEEVAS